MYPDSCSQIHIYLESVSWGGGGGMHTSFCIQNKMTKNGTFIKKKNGATGLKFGMETQLDSANNMG